MMEHAFLNFLFAEILFLYIIMIYMMWGFHLNFLYWSIIFVFCFCYSFIYNTNIEFTTFDFESINRKININKNNTRVKPGLDLCEIEK